MDIDDIVLLYTRNIVNNTPAFYYSVCMKCKIVFKFYVGKYVKYVWCKELGTIKDKLLNKMKSVPFFQI